MHQGNHPEFIVIAKNHHVWFYGFGCESEGVFAAVKFENLFHADSYLCAEGLYQFCEFCISFLNICNLLLAYQTWNIREVFHFDRKPLNYGEATTHVFDFGGVAVWVALCLLFVCVHDYTLALKHRKAKPFTWRVFGENFAKVFTLGVHNPPALARFCETP